MGQSKRPRGTVVLGLEIAAAHEAERRRLTQPHEPSPLGSARYDKWRGELRLSNPQHLPLDARIGELCAAFAEAEAAERERIRASLTLDDLYTLMTFSQRASVFALRREDPDVQLGLVAVAMVDPIRVDPGDVVWALGVLQHATSRVQSGQRRRALFESAARLADPSVAKLMRASGSARVRSASFRAWAYTEVETASGPGLIRWGRARYRPTYDLASIGLEITDVVDGQGYQADDPEVACGVPAVWLDPNGRPGARLSGVRAALHVRADRRPVESARGDPQSLMLWVAEMRSESEASSLTSRAVKPTGVAFIRHGVDVGRLFCVIVQSSPMYGVAPVETKESIRRFGPPIERILSSRSR